MTAFISAWISNTATTAMMFGIGLSILAALERPGQHVIDPRYATGIMLMTSFAASIGGLATPIGTPANVIGLGFIRTLAGKEIPFFSWSLIGVPVVLILFAFLYLFLNALSPSGFVELPGASDRLRAEREELGPWTAGQRSVAIAFSVTVALWIAPGIVAIIAGERSAAYAAVVGSVPEGVAAIIGAMLLFVLPGSGAVQSTGMRRRASTGGSFCSMGADSPLGCSPFRPVLPNRSAGG